jgi:hypothetical protein
MSILLSIAMEALLAASLAQGRTAPQPCIEPRMVGADQRPQPAQEPTWVRIGPDYRIGEGIATQVSVHPKRPTEMVAATRPFGMWLSENAGNTWKRTGTPFDAGLNSGPNWGLVRAPSDPDIVYVSLENPGMWRSPDGGRTWVDRSASLPGGRAKRGVVVAVHPRQPDTVWMGTDGGLFKTSDGGQTWRALTRGLPTGRTKNDGDRHQTVSAVLLDPRNPDTVRIGIYATGNNEPAGVWRSDDGGESWQSTSAGIRRDRAQFTGGTEIERKLHQLLQPDWIHWLVQSASEPDTLYARAGSGFYRSRDGGTTWQHMPDAAIQMGMAVDPADALRVVAAKRDGGALLSDDGGESWRDIGAGLPTGKVASASEQKIVLKLPDGSTMDLGGSLRSQVHVVESFTFAPDDHLTLYASATSGVYRLKLAPRASQP